MANKSASLKQGKRNDALAVSAKEGDNVAVATAAAILAPDFRHGVAAAQTNKALFGSMFGSPGIGDYAQAIGAIEAKARAGELSFVSEMLAAQAVTLDGMFTELARRMALNMGEYIGAAETYGRLAMKAQAQSRATMEALTNLHQPREQTVRHVHVNEGGQAVIAEEFHNHQGGAANEQSNGQSHATGAAGASPPLLGSDSQGLGLPSASRKGKTAVPDARRDQSRRT